MLGTGGSGVAGSVHRMRTPPNTRRVTREIAEITFTPDAASDEMMRHVKAAVGARGPDLPRAEA